MTQLQNNDPYRSEALVQQEPRISFWSRIKRYFNHTWLGKRFYCDKCKESKPRSERKPMYRLWYLYPSDVHHPYYCKKCSREWWDIELQKEEDENLQEEVHKQLRILRAKKEAEKIISKEV